MGTLTPDQRNYLYLLEAERAGIHKPVLAALYAVQDKPVLPSGETGLGIAPANRIPLDQVNTFQGQVQFAANTVRSITDQLIANGATGNDLWLAAEGYYSDRLLEAIARGYSPSISDLSAARLEPSDPTKLKAAYLEDLKTDFSAENLPQNLAYLDNALLALAERLPEYYAGLPHQRTALLEALRIWRKLDSRQVAINALTIQLPMSTVGGAIDESQLDQPLLQFAQQISRNYVGLPHQREALLRLTQLWRQLDSREATIASLKASTSPEIDLSVLDAALIALVQNIPGAYKGLGKQRNALVEGFRVWNGLASRSTALLALGIEPQILASDSQERNVLVSAASQIDRQLLQFWQRVPIDYGRTDVQRDALIRLTQLWRDLPTRAQALRSLLEDLKRLGQARRGTQDAPPAPRPMVLASRPDRWTPRNIQLYAAIITNGNFTWAEATSGGSRMPPDQETVDAIVRIARLAQQARDRIARPFHVTSWYRPPAVNARVGGVSNSRHIVGDAIDFYCDGLTGNQIYWALDPWWPGGLGRYPQYPYLSHIDARGFRARWG